MRWTTVVAQMHNRLLLLHWTNNTILVSIVHLLTSYFLASYAFQMSRGKVEDKSALLDISKYDKHQNPNTHVHLLFLMNWHVSSNILSFILFTKF